VSNRHGTLYVVATPIGNLADISQRALATLAAVDLVVAEDTRHSRRLLDHHGIRAKLTSLHEHNERAAVPGLVARLAAGSDLALISDAGTPLISDPGFRLVRGAREAGIDVVPLPGPCAAITALSVAGLPTDRFVFEGFLPARRSQRLAHLALLRGETRTLIFYESGRRLAETLSDLVETCGAQRPAVLARELTKIHETLIDGTLDELQQRVADDPDQVRGEIVLLVAGASDEEAQQAEPRRLLAALLDEGLAASRAAAVAARFCNLPRRQLYRLVQEIRDDAMPDRDAE